MVSAKACPFQWALWRFLSGFFWMQTDSAFLWPSCCPFRMQTAQGPGSLWEPSFMASEKQLMDGNGGSQMGPLGMLMGNGPNVRLVTCDIRGLQKTKVARVGLLQTRPPHTHTPAASVCEVCGTENQ